MSGTPHLRLFSLASNRRAWSTLSEPRPLGLLITIRKVFLCQRTYGRLLLLSFTCACQGPSKSCRLRVLIVLSQTEGKRSGFFFDEGFAVSGLVHGDHFFRQFVGHVVVVRKLHRIGSAPLRLGREVGGIAQHFGERHLPFDDDVVA